MVALGERTTTYSTRCYQRSARSIGTARSYDALIDSMGVGDINAVEPPYLLKISGANEMAPEVLFFIRDLRRDLADRIQAVIDDGYDAGEVHIVLDGEV